MMQLAKPTYNENFQKCDLSISLINKTIDKQPVIAATAKPTIKLIQSNDCKGDVGPTFWDKQIDIIEDHVKDAIDKGAKILVGGKRNPMFEGLYFEPTVLAMTVTESTFLRGVGLLNYIREAHGRILTIVGGVFPTFAPTRVIVVSEERLRQAEHDARKEQLQALDNRIEELTKYRKSLNSTIKKMEPTKVGGDLDALDEGTCDV